MNKRKAKVVKKGNIQTRLARYSILGTTKGTTDLK